MAGFQRFSLGLLALSLIVPALSAQAVVSARSGLIHYAEGEVYAGDKQVEIKFAEFPQLKEGEVLRTGEGRAEVLLTPGVFLRLAENSSVKMVTNRLVDTRLEVLSGSVLLEVAESQKENAVTLVHKNAVLEFPKKGLFRLDADSGAFKVYDGKATVLAQDDKLTVKEGRQTQLAGVLSPEKFDKKTGDAFYRWAGRRSNNLALSNLQAARSMMNSGSYWRTSGWHFSPYFGAFTFIPGHGVYSSPFGGMYYCPSTVYRAFAPRRVYVPNDSWGGGGIGRSSGSASSGGIGGSVGRSSGGASPAPSSDSGRSSSGGRSR
ncbi:MAG: FecR domain-containing protein [Bryobacteraceae bacterium]